ncbi:MAG TPA: response regulator [Opitutaceae bacterium]|nr:response regulator [Opitutaceae bacterium]
MKKPCTVLLVEDDENDVVLLQHAFREVGLSNPLQIARDGQEAMDFLSRLVEARAPIDDRLPCLAIMDLKMPRRNGLDLLHWLRHQRVLRSLPVILFSSSAHRHDVERAYALGANSFVVKPASTERRVEFARHVKDYWLNFNQPPLMCSEGIEAALQLHLSDELADSF